MRRPGRRRGPPRGCRPRSVPLSGGARTWVPGPSRIVLVSLALPAGQPSTGDAASKRAAKTASRREQRPSDATTSAVVVTGMSAARAAGASARPAIRGTHRRRHHDILAILSPGGPHRQGPTTPVADALRVQAGTAAAATSA